MSKKQLASAKGPELRKSKNCDESTKTTANRMQIVAFVIIAVSLVLSLTVFSTIKTDASDYTVNVIIILIILTFGAIIMGLAYSDRFKKSIKDGCEKKAAI